MPMKFHLNCHTIGFRRQTQKLRPHYKAPAFSTLAMKGSASRLQLVNNIKSEFNWRSIDDKKNSLSFWKWLPHRMSKLQSLNQQQSFSTSSLHLPRRLYSTYSWFLSSNHLQYSYIAKHCRLRRLRPYLCNYAIALQYHWIGGPLRRLTIQTKSSSLKLLQQQLFSL